MNVPEKSTVQLRDTAISVSRGGRGEPLLWLGDAYGTSDWPPILDRLSERFDVIAPVHPGFGGSDMPPWLDSMADLANFYLDLLDHLDLSGVHLAGASIGGWIAAELAIRNTGRLKSLILIDASGIRSPGVSGIDPFVTNDEQSIRDLYVDPKQADRAIALALAPEREDALLRNKIAAAKLTWQPRLHDPHLEKWPHRIDVPTLVVWGEADRLLPKELARAWQRGIPGAKLVLLLECGHLPHIEKPDALAAEIEGFIAGIETAS
jgi:pimeloyl-ACP methyl ester carboxylesterase